MPIHAVARKYGTSRGFVQTLAQTCEGFAAGTIQFCDLMAFGMLKSVLEHMSDRLKAGARADLLDLAKIPFVKSRTARVLWDNGFRSLMAVAEADPKDLVPTLLLVRTHRSIGTKYSLMTGSTEQDSIIWRRRREVPAEGCA